MSDRTVVLIVVAALLVSTPVLALSGELFLLGGITQASYGTDTDTDAQAARLTFVTGDKYQFRADVGFLRKELGAPIPTGQGPVPGKPRGPHGQGNQTDSQISSNAGNGSGSGSTDASGDDPASDPVDPVQDEWVSGLGDVRLAGSRRLVGGGAKVFRMDLGAQVKIPTADPDEDLGTGEWDAYLGLTSEYRFWSATGFGGFGWNYLGDPEWQTLNDVVEGYIGVESEPLGGRLILSGWVEGNPEVVDGLGSRAALGFGLRSLGKMRWRLLTTLGLTDAAQDFTILFGTSFGVKTPTVGTRGPVR
ncbi:MAG: hypothetical protein WBP10_04945 [Thermoanaerobaculia bacterium]